MKRFAGYNPSYLDRRLMEREARKNTPMIKPQGGRPSIINHRVVCLILCNHGKRIEEIAELVGKTKTQTHAYIQYLRTIGFAIPKRSTNPNKEVAVSSPKEAKPSLPTRLPEIVEKRATVGQKKGQISSGRAKQFATGSNPETIAISKQEGRYVQINPRTWILKKSA